MNIQAKIPTTIVTGFLGAGKTTLIRDLVLQDHGKRIALIVNEFGDLGFDASLLRACGDPDCDDGGIVELTNGCICCTVADDFLPAMEEVLDRDPMPDHIVIETSGLAIPQPLVQAFSWPTIRHRVTVDGVLTVVDAAAVEAGFPVSDVASVERQRAQDEALDHETPLEELFEDQLGCADMVILSKTDLIDAAARPAIEAALAPDMRDGVKVIATSNGSLPASALLGLGVAAENDIARHNGHHHDEDGEHDHDEFESVVLQIIATDRDSLASSVEALLARPGILRVKGHVAVSGKQAVLAVQAVGRRVETWFDPSVNSAAGLVVIGETGLDAAAIESHLSGLSP